MSLPAGQQRALQRIEQVLLADDAGLDSLFAVFTRLVEHDPMPWAERVTSGLQRQLQRPAAVKLIAVTAFLGILVLAILPHAGRACGPAPPGSTQAAAARTGGCRPGTPAQPGPPHAR